MYGKIKKEKSKMKLNKIQNKKIKVYVVNPTTTYIHHGTWRFDKDKHFLKWEEAEEYFLGNYEVVKTYNEVMIKRRCYKDLAPIPKINYIECKFKDLNKYFGDKIDDALALALSQTLDKLEPVKKETAEDQAFEKEFEGNN